MNFRLLIIYGLLSLDCSGSHDKYKDYSIQPVSFINVQFTDKFWLPRLETNRTVTIPYDFRKSEETGRISNFAKAGGLMEGAFEGERYNDSDVFKIIEGAAYSLSMNPDLELEQYLDDLIVKIAAAQEADGYLFTTRTIDPQRPAKSAGDTRWSYLKHSHELYNMGHAYEAAAAHYQATGKRTLLDVALKNADLIDSVFGPGKRYDVPGHQEIEIGLVKLYRLTGEEKYLKLAKFFLDQRGRPENRKELYGQYAQDHVPVIEQDRPVGHAVRAVYMYSGMADIAAMTGERPYIHALDRIWENLVYKKLYLTGGIGSRHHGESFGEDYELPNASAYNETCAAIANMLWNYRMFLLHQDGKFIDIFERTLYNGFLSGISLTGNEFFYTNPLGSDGSHRRSPWFNCSCCPTNIVRFLPSLPGYVYAQKNGEIYVNLYVQSTGLIETGNKQIRLSQITNYPWSGTVRLTVEPEFNSEFKVLLRIPGWARNQPVPGDLYSYSNAEKESTLIKINGTIQNFTIEKGYAIFKKKWEKGDTIEINFPMPVRQVVAHAQVTENVGKLAIERGPIVYCAEGVDNHFKIKELRIPNNALYQIVHIPDLLNGITMITSSVKRLSGQSHPLKLIPYYAWAHRSSGEMAVWLSKSN